MLVCPWCPLSATECSGKIGMYLKSYVQLWSSNREAGPERYCDSSEVGRILGCFGAFPPNFITEVRGN